MAPMLSLPRWLAAMATVVVLAAPTLGRAADERWYIVELGGRPAGWMSTWNETSDGRITSGMKTSLKIARGATALEITTEGTFVETEAGEPVSMRSVQAMAGPPMTIEYTFGPEELTLVSTSAGQEVRSSMPLPEGEWLTPKQAERRKMELLKTDPESFTLRTISPLAGAAVIDVTWSGFERTVIDVGGAPVKVVRCVTTTSAQPGVPSVEYLDDEGEVVVTETSVGGLAIRMVASSKAAAMAAAAGGFEAPEMMVSTFVRPDRPIPDARSTKRASYILSIPDGQMPELPRTGAQRVEALSPTSVRVAVVPGDPAAANEAEAADPAFRSASIMINGNDPIIRKLTERAVRGAGDDPAAKAEAIRRFVHRHIRKKNLDVGFATASDVAVNRQGDCSEHGALLAAMLRAEGIPARVASGLVYVDEFIGAEAIFGYHMWAQALLPVNGEPTWVDLDATLPDETPFDATHITLGVSPLSDGELQDAFVAIAPLLGRLELRVERIE